jgi:hypothetical protein
MASANSTPGLDRLATKNSEAFCSLGAICSGVAQPETAMPDTPAQSPWHLSSDSKEGFSNIAFVLDQFIDVDLPKSRITNVKT